MDYRFPQLDMFQPHLQRRWDSCGVDTCQNGANRYLSQHGKILTKTPKDSSEFGQLAFSQVQETCESHPVILKGIRVNPLMNLDVSKHILTRRIGKSTPS